MYRIKNITALLLLLLLSSQMNAQLKDAKHVLLIGVDGLGAYAIPQAEMPHLKSLMTKGSSSFEARSVLPSSSAVNWASMLMGAGPTFHGYTEWGSQVPEIPSIETTKNNLFPSIFSLIKNQVPDAKTAAIYSWGGIGYLLEKDVIDFVIPTKDDETLTVSEASRIIKDHQPLFTFVHLSEPDNVGHGIGHDTPEYYAELKKVDERIGKLIAAVKEAGIENETIIMVTADHGGIDKGHGGKSLVEVQIPWIIAGPGIIQNQKLDSSIVTYDTAATIAFILGLEMPQVWRGQAIKEVFKP
ncbi:alkaline phosphatase [Gelidibacter japonicus]|uniref:alkaline phosphatase n=1 Tax=Gelidibacter japonicus TaxID=1962232 RepID=UPI0013D5033B|nr:alkaline phosphatase [Gelidibacter japonicus]